MKNVTDGLKAIVLARGSNLMDLPGVVPVVGDITRFADRNRFVSWTSTALWTPRPESRPGTAFRVPETAG